MVRIVGKNRGTQGITLLELGIVVAIFGLIVIGVLTALAVMNTSRETSVFAGDVAAIRSAITRWGAGGPLYISSATPTLTTTATVTNTINVALKNFSQIGGLLPAGLQALGARTAMATIAGGTPWGGDYTLVEATPANPRTWGLMITMIPPGLAPVLANQLRTTSAGEISITPLLITNSTPSISLAVTE